MVIDLHESNAQALCVMLPEGWIPSVLTINLMQNYIVDSCARIKVVARSSNACYVSTNCCFFSLLSLCLLMWMEAGSIIPR